MHLESLSRNRLDSATFAGKNGFRCWSLVLETAKKRNSNLLLLFCPSLGNKRFKAFFLECGVPLPPLPSALLLSTPLRTTAWFGRSSKVTEHLAVLISIRYLSSPLSPSGDFPPLNRTALEGKSEVCSFAAPSPRSQWQVDYTCCTIPPLSQGFGPSSPPTTGTNWADRVWWPSSFPAFSRGPWWQKKHKAGKEPWKQVNQAQPPELLQCLSQKAFGSRDGHLWIWGKLFQIWGFKYCYGFCSHPA